MPALKRGHTAAHPDFSYIIFQLSFFIGEFKYQVQQDRFSLGRSETKSR
jgi:hypothetical protein